MRQGRELAAVLDGRLDERLVDRVLEAAAEAPSGAEVQEAIVRVVEFAETDPIGTRKAIWALRGDAEALELLEHDLPLEPSRATLALGGALQLASIELGSSDPDLRSRMPELMRWLEGDW